MQNDNVKFKKNVLLKNYTTFRIGGRAKYFFVAKTKQSLIKAIKKAKESNLPFFILGGGSNLLVADEGYDGLVIKMQKAKCKKRNGNSKFKIICESGLSLTKLVSKSLEAGATGLEWAAGIPGATVGGAIRGNAGAFGKSIANLIKKVEVFDSKDLRFKIYDLRDCKFNYRDSIFKHNSNLIILSAEIQLEKGKKKEIQTKIKKYLGYRKNNQPLNFPSAGSVFKNSKEYSAGELIERCGLKGIRIGDAEISSKHANFIINLGKAEAKDVLELIKLVKEKVKQKFKIELEEEIQYLSYPH